MHVVQGSLPEGHGKPHGHHHVGDPPVLWIKYCQEVAPHLENKAGFYLSPMYYRDFSLCNLWKLICVNQNCHGYKSLKQEC